MFGAAGRIPHLHQYRAIVIELQRQAIEAESKLSPGPAIDGRRSHRLAVQRKSQPADRFDRDQPRGLRGDAGMIRIDPEIRQLDIVLVGAPDRQHGLVEVAITHQPAAARHEFDRADAEGHLPVTSNRKRR